MATAKKTKVALEVLFAQGGGGGNDGGGAVATQVGGGGEGCEVSVPLVRPLTKRAVGALEQVRDCPHAAAFGLCRMKRGARRLPRPFRLSRTHRDVL